MNISDRLSGESNCCGAPILDEDENGVGICWECKDGCQDVNYEINKEENVA
jgi:hypothetical protein